MSEVTSILEAAAQGDPRAAAQLLPLVYDELRKLAAARLAHEKPGQTLQATALVHEAYLRLVKPGVGSQESGVGRQGSDLNSPTPDPRCPTPLAFDSRGHFFAAAAEAMRRILIEGARRKSREKHGGGMGRVELDEANIACRMPPEELLALDEALTKLAAEDAQKAKLVQLRFFAGLTSEEAAASLGISAVTAKRHWRYARAWLHQQMAGDAALLDMQPGVGQDSCRTP
jgi:RNA polymerase sigma factor (sigma-70 family)